MPIPFNCPFCGRRTDVDERYAGQSGPCSGCGRTITVPWPAGPASTAPPGQSSGLAVVVIVILLVLVVLLVCGGLFAVWLVRARSVPAPVPQGSPAVGESQCLNNLKLIGLGLHNYHDVHGCFPPAYVADEKGKPKHSWRVLILPYIEQQPLYTQYNFQEPFDGPTNRRLANVTIPAYHCPDGLPTIPSDASYLMIVGPGTIAEGPKGRKLSEIKDGTSRTIAIVEVSGSGIPWMEPKDLKLDDFVALFKRPRNVEPNRNHPDRINVLFADGSVRSLDATTAAEQIRAMATIAGNEPVVLP
jgi:prepilin-type processing-associated H-X9-DG protein